MLRIRSKYSKYAFSLALFYILFHSIYSLTLYYAFRYHGADFGKFVQAFWTTLNRGKLFETTLHITSSNPSGCYFGWHFAPILFLILPIFALWQSPETLLIIKSVVVGLSVAALFLLCRELLSDERLAFLVLVLYALNPSLFCAQLSDFQEQCFLPLLIFSMYYFFKKENLRGFFVALFLCLADVTFVCLLLFSFFLGVAFSEFRDRRVLSKEVLRKRKAWMVLIALVASVVWWFLAKAVIAMFSTQPVLGFFHVLVREDGGYVLKSMTPSEMIITAFRNPTLIVNAILYDFHKKIAGLLFFILPLLGVPLLEPRFLLPLAAYLMGVWTTGGEPRYTIVYHYPFYLLPFMYIAFAELLSKRRILTKLMSLFFVATIALYVYNWCDMVIFGEYLPSFDERTNALWKAVSVIPANASVLTDNNVFPAFATRDNAYCLSDEALFREMQRVLGGLDVEYIVIDRSWGNAWGGGGYAGKLIPYAVDKLRSGQYGLYAWGGGVRVLKKGFAGNPIRLYDVERYSYRSLLIPKTTSLKPDIFSESKFVVAHERGRGVGTIWFGPYVTLIPGKYVVKYRLKVPDRVDEDSEVLYLDIVSDCGTHLHASKVVHGRDLPPDGEWFNVFLEFEVHQTHSDFEFRGFAKSDATILLDYILVQHIE